MTIAVLILAHKNPEQIKRLVNRLQHPAIKVFIHADKKSGLAKATFDSDLSLIKNSAAVYWGDFSPVQATLNGMKEISEALKQFDFFILLSGQDYPIKSLEKLVHFLEKNKNKEFIDHRPISKEGWEKAMGRYQYYHYRRNKNVAKWAFFKGVKLLMKISGIKRKPPFPIWGGSQWFTISFNAFSYILDYAKRNPGYLSFMKRCNFTDEMFFQTILLNSIFKDNCVNNNLRYIDWNESSVKKVRNPKVLSMEDWNAIRNSKAFFARKFDTNIDKEILDKIDSSYQTYKQPPV